MTNLEFIEDEIKVLTKRIKELKEEEDLHWNYEHEDEALECDFQIEEYEDLLKKFQQIKAELEAWEICKSKQVDLYDVIHTTNYKQYKLENINLLEQYLLTKKEYETVQKSIGGRR